MNKTKKDFFISYNKHDEHWAEWIAWQLETAGYDVEVQLWDWGPGNNFIIEMQKASELCQRTIIVLSPHFLESKYTKPEWAAAFAQDPTGEKRLLIPVRVAQCELHGFFKPIVYIDFLETPPADKFELREYLIEKLLDGVKIGRKKPKTEPPLPDLNLAAPAVAEAGSEMADVISKARKVRRQMESDANRLVFCGTQHAELLSYFVSNWLLYGPAAAILQGFPGCGKTQLARAIANASERTVIQVVPQAEAPDPTTALLIDLAEELSSFSENPHSVPKEFPS